MRSHFKKIGVLMMALVLTLTLTVPAFAASEAGSRFTDVPVDSPWFEGVLRSVADLLLQMSLNVQSKHLVSRNLKCNFILLEVVMKSKCQKQFPIS